MNTPQSKQLICSVYRSSNKEGMYLYVEKRIGLDKVPEELKTLFGKPIYSMTLLLTPEKKLAIVDVLTVMGKVEQAGYFLQMPPKSDDYMNIIHEKNNKI